MTKDAPDTTLCGGVLISPKAILTTAECVANHSPSSLSVRVGSLSHTSGGTVTDTTKITTHPQYNTDTLNANAAVVQLSNKVSGIQPVSLAESSPRDGTKLTMYGWGSTDRFAHRPASHLQQLNALALSGKSCRRDWKDLREITDTMMCDVPDAGAGPCTGDLGGPIVSEQGRLVALITSLDQCAHSDHPGVDVDVAAVRDWISGFTK
ncbi:trypsin-like cysteine/serine peptidase domain-containing protein [Aspergillus floccosus]